MFEYLDRDGSEIRAIVFTGSGKNFTAGIDLLSAPMDLMKVREKATESDPGRAAVMVLDFAFRIQNAISAIEKVRVPVIAAINGLCLGIGNDIISTCDIRICQANSRFSIKEVDIGMASDVGIHQRLQKVTGNSSWVRELALTGRDFDASEALAYGYVSRICQNQEEVLSEAIKTAVIIAEKSPVAVSATKMSLNFSRDHSVQAGLDHIALLNSSLL